MKRSNRTTLVAILLLGVTFAGGVVTGVAGDRLLLLSEGRVYPREGLETLVRRLPERLDRNLDLDDRQREQIEEILRRRHQEIERQWMEVSASIETEMGAARSEIEAVLNETQREQFRRQSERWERLVGSDR
jgi:shikimate kinase